MAKVRVRMDWFAETEFANVEINDNRLTYRIGRGEDAWISIPDSAASQLDLNKFEVVYETVKPEVAKVVIPITTPVETKVEPTIKKTILDKIKQVTGDILDDGKRNYSNDKTKKSPGRKKKK